VSVTQHNWLTAQTTRRYPLDDNATGTDDTGVRIKDDIILDAHIRFPQAAGQYIFLAGLTVTDNIVTAVFLACDSDFSVASFTPLCAVTVPQPAATLRYYNVEPLYPGVGGYVVFGDTTEPFTARFSTPQQSLLAPKVARPYQALPIPTLGKKGRTDPLTGIVTILAGTDIEIVKETFTVDTIDYDAMVIRVARSTTPGVNNLAKYIGPCGKRPESQTCDRIGVQAINGVTPDCDGNIEIVFPDILEGPYTGCGEAASGLTLDTNIRLDQVCTPNEPTRFTGTDLCLDSSSIAFDDFPGSVEVMSEDDNDDDISSSDTTDSSSSLCLDLPFSDCFTSLLDPAWQMILGSHVFVSGISPSELCIPTVPCYTIVDFNLPSLPSLPSLSSMSHEVIEVSSSSSLAMCDDPESATILRLNDPSRRNVMIWQSDLCEGNGSLDRRVLSYVQLTNNAVNQNAGILLNYNFQENPENTTYWALQINRLTNRVELLRFNGTILILENFVTPPLPFSLTDWYELEAVASQVGTEVNIQVNVSNVSTPTWPSVSFNFLTSVWGESTGYFGIHTNRARSNFSFWRLADA